ncbi:MAG TPA: MBOAT family O-acyltransferase [Lachnospiraceae bacterium]|nr:MBOAT family O-acyltransferase [Lachnospiraceae bacterium]
MLFNSFSFLIFFPIVVFIYLIIPKKVRYLWLLIASYYFYMCWNPRYVILLLLSTLITYISGLLLEKANHSQKDHVTSVKKLIVAFCFITNIGILTFFKYFNFLLENVNDLLHHFHLSVISNPFSIILPVGISFYTFQALSYIMDVYRGKNNAEKNPFKYALYVSFFPQLIAGPIERSGTIISQINETATKKLWNYERITGGFVLMLWGYFQKMVIADRVGILVDTVFDNYYMYGTIPLLVGAVGFAIQLYCDFASYSAIAIGAAKVMGFTLMENFDTPYFATSIQDFWRRWHISLSTWFRDYLYFPLGGSRCSKLKKYRNLMITFIVSGLWHGANWTYLVWGALHGLYQIVGGKLRPTKTKMNEIFHTKTESFSYRLGQILVTFALVDFAWIFFRSKSITDACRYIYRIFTRFDLWTLFDKSMYSLGLDWMEYNILLGSMVILLLVSLVRYLLKQPIDVFLSGQCLWFRWAVIFGLLLGIIIFGVYGIDVNSIKFLYFQF